MSTPYIWIFVIFFVVHLMFSAGAGYVAVRLFPLRRNPFVWRLVLYMNGLVIDGLVGVALLFLAKGVKWTWPFAIVFFAGRALEDAARLPLLIYLIKGPGELQGVQADKSGDLSPDFWRAEFRQAVRSEVRDEYLKPWIELK